MSQLNAVLQRLGGPGAVTWWAFFVSLADRLLTVSVQPINMGASAEVRIVATLIAQCIMFAPLVILRFTLLRDPLRPRPWVALAGFAVADVLRAVAIDQLLHRMGGIPLMPELRILSGFIPTLVPLLVTAYVVNTLRERHRELTTLLEARDQLEQARNDAESAVQARNEALVQQVRTVMDSELATLASQEPTAVVAQLQRTATDVVRPLSHELATSFAERERPETPRMPIQVGWRRLVGEAFLEQPLRPGLTVVLLSGIWISAAVVFVPIRWALTVTLPLIAGVLALGNVALRQVLLRLWPLGRVIVVFAACLVVGAMVWAVVRLLAGDWPSAEAISLAAGFYVTSVSAAMAVVSGVLAGRATLLQDTAEAVDDLRLQVLRTRQLQWFHQRALARALHGPVQSAVTAAALRLTDEARTGTLSAQLVERVHSDLIDVVDVLNAPDDKVVSLDDSLSRLAGTWEGVCAVTPVVGEGVAAAVASDLVTRACVIDIVTDAVSNAVRHGKARTVRVELGIHEDRLTITVTDDGEAPVSGAGSGLGTALLNECAVAWSLSQETSGHVLSAVLLAPAPSATD